MRTIWFVYAIAVAGGTLTFLSPAGAADESGLVAYEQTVKPLLRNRCFACHGALKQEANLRLDTVDLMKSGGVSGAVIIAGDAADSLIVDRVTASDASERMPPDGPPLSNDQIEVLRRWIDSGARSPLDEQPEAKPTDHWAFQKPLQRVIPSIDGNMEQPQNAVDAFILSRLQRERLQARPPAEPHLQLRRVYLDLIGVPPEYDEVMSFVQDRHPQSWERVVDQLLADPRYGERWGRHWMDVWRYSDWYGRRHVPDVWNSAPQIWRWRDWIVQSLNEDLGYDQMIQQMLAGDEVAPENDSAGYATGFLIRNWYALNPNDWMRANVEHTGKAFLGLTFNCAHCHDHKYDPISQDDYFRLRAFFEPIDVRQDRVPGEADPGPFQDYVYSGPLRKVVRLGAVRVFDKTPDAPTWFYTGGDERNRETERGSLSPGVPDILSDSAITIQPVDLPLTAWYPGLRPSIIESLIEEQHNIIRDAEIKLNEQKEVKQDLIARLEREAQLAELELQDAANSATQDGRAPVISGKQSLLLDAGTGRRILFNTLSDVKHLPEGSKLSFRCRLQTDTHFNFQLAKDAEKGLTAGYVGFDAGRIMAYRPATFTEFQVGTYDFGNGQSQFVIELVILQAADQCDLTIRSEPDGQVLVDAVPVALNGWNPVGDPTKAIFLDARTGSVVLVDDILITSPRNLASASPRTSDDLLRGDILTINFEAPDYQTDRDVVGMRGWKVSTIGTAPATSMVTTYGSHVELRAAAAKVQSALRRLRCMQHPERLHQSQIKAANCEIESINARVAAERAKYQDSGQPLSADLVAQLAEQAARKERAANALNARVAVLAAETSLTEAELLPDDAESRQKQIESFQQSLVNAQQEFNAAEQAEQDPEIAHEYTDFGVQYPTSSTGRRTALAKWITDRNNPLTARVAVNHIWLRHFHAPLVASVSDFGRNGAKPTHPELLDWLAVEFMESGWSMKSLHRLIVTSDAYRRSSSAGNSVQESAADPENRLLWRMNAGRMEAEVVRDSLLSCAGKLDLTIGGQELENDQALTTFRRSLYYSCNPENDGKSELGKLFDAPNPGDCYRRSRTIIPQQALALTNSQLMHDLSTTLAEQVFSRAAVSDLPVKNDPDDPSDGDWRDEKTILRRCLRYLFLQILSRPASPAELQLCEQVYEQQVMAASVTTQDVTTQDVTAA
ncbi:MAG: DUF1553 domain-containing protein, partial [Planctomycetaceae bacterium]|nr:DUF1553 domain-containing protein [Planctomycetaceae bacterium]